MRIDFAPLTNHMSLFRDDLSHKNWAIREYTVLKDSAKMGQ